MLLVHLEEKSAKKDEEVESKDLMQHWWGHRGIHGAPCEGQWKTSRWKRSVVITVAVWSTSSMQLPISKSIGSKFTFEPQGGNSAKEGSLGLSDESDHAQDTPGGGP